MFADGRLRVADFNTTSRYAQDSHILGLPGSLKRVDELRRRTFSEECLRRESQVHSVLRKLTTRSQYFSKVGVLVELRWVPSHSAVEGIRRADRAALRAAADDSGGPGFTNGVYSDEALQLIELEVTGARKEKGLSRDHVALAVGCQIVTPSPNNSDPLGRRRGGLPLACPVTR
jgi:hypothetical protein